MELDILLERDNVFFPVEIRSKFNPTKDDTKRITAFRAFRTVYPMLKIAPGLAICPCEKFVKISENDYALPWDCI
ncbi:MAG: hypothetical protein JW749_00775 [Sedimentisphaerales bacterium]|nr:hypothetical protein [Sedimentisphaerales bacterium]